MQYLICPKCDANNSKCPHCGGGGEVVEINGHLFAWQRRLSWSFIYSQRLWGLLRKIIDGSFVGLLVVGLFTSSYFFYLFTQDTNDILEWYQFFFQPGLYNLVFFITLLIGLYIYYEIQTTKSSNRKINYKKIIKATTRKKVNAIDGYFTKEALKVVDNAYLLGLSYRQPVSAAHLFYSLLADSQTLAVFKRLNLNTKDLKIKLDQHFKKRAKSGKVYFNKDARYVLQTALFETLKLERNEISPLEILLAIVSFTNPAEQLLYELEIESAEIEHVVEWLRLQKQVGVYWEKLKSKAAAKPEGPVNRAYTSLASPLLDQFSQDLTSMASAGVVEPVIGSENTVEQIFKTLASSKKQGVLLVGEPGTGKTSAMGYLAELMASENVPSFFKDKRLVSLSVPALVAGASAPGAIEKRLLETLHELGRAGNIILFIDRIEEVVGLKTETAESLDIASVLSEELNKNYFVLIAATTPESYTAYLAKSTLDETLEKVEIKEMDVENSIRALMVKALILEKRYQVYFTYQSLEKAVELSARLITGQYLPGKAVGILEKSAGSVAGTQDAKDARLVLEEDVAKVVTEISKIPVTKITAQESTELLNLEKEMKQRVVGQTEAVDVIAKALRRARTKIGSKDRPIASFLFLGPTGVGKTEISRVLSDIYFGGEENIIRLDMSEYSSLDAIPKLLGRAGDAQPGYLINQIKQKPFSLVLLDELEKASSDVLDLFLQVFEDGRLTGSDGKTYSFNNTIIIATSNAGAEYVQEAVKNKVSIEKIREELLNKYLLEHFRPEFINRFDAVVTFRPLTLSEVERVVELMLDKLKSNLLGKGINLIYINQAVKELAKAGYDPKFGARPLRRIVQDKVENKIAEILLSGKVGRRDTLVLQGIEDIQIEKAEEI